MSGGPAVSCDVEGLSNAMPVLGTASTRSRPIVESRAISNFKTCISWCRLRERQSAAADGGGGGGGTPAPAKGSTKVATGGGNCGNVSPAFPAPNKLFGLANRWTHDVVVVVGRTVGRSVCRY